MACIGSMRLWTAGKIRRVIAARALGVFGALAINGLKLLAGLLLALVLAVFFRLCGLGFPRGNFLTIAKAIEDTVSSSISSASSRAGLCLASNAPLGPNPLSGMPLAMKRRKLRNSVSHAKGPNVTR
jgi:hypothetical protein